MRLYVVGGAVRDYVLGRKHSDVDFAVEAESYQMMVDELRAKFDLHIWREDAKFVTVRGRIPYNKVEEKFGKLFPFDSDRKFISADFTLCRAETMYSDGRHPDSVTPAPLITDLGRRDFTMNAMAVAEDGTIIDPYEGQRDLLQARLTPVGMAYDRMYEDPLRMLRALRFATKYALDMSSDIMDVLNDRVMVKRLRTIPVERVREELNRIFGDTNWWYVLTRMAFTVPILTHEIAHLFPELQVNFKQMPVAPASVFSVDMEDEHHG